MYLSNYAFFLTQVLKGNLPWNMLFKWNPSCWRLRNLTYNFNFKSSQSLQSKEMAGQWSLNFSVNEKSGKAFNFLLTESGYGKISKYSASLSNFSHSIHLNKYKIRVKKRKLSTRGIVKLDPVMSELISVFRSLPPGW